VHMASYSATVLALSASVTPFDGIQAR